MEDGEAAENGGQIGDKPEEELESEGYAREKWQRGANTIRIIGKMTPKDRFGIDMVVREKSLQFRQEEEKKRRLWPVKDRRLYMRLLDEPDTSGKTVLMRAVEDDSIKRTAKAIEIGQDVNAADNKGATSIFYAAGKKVILTKMLLFFNADLTQRDEFNNTALHLHCMFGILEGVELLLEGGANVHARNNLGETPLSMCCQRYSIQAADASAGYGTALEREETVAIAIMLLAKDAGILSSSFNERKTPLMHAATSGNQGLIQLLLQNGADVHASDKRGFRAVHYCSSVSALKLLQSFGANFYVMDESGMTIMHAAARTWKPAVMEWLILETDADCKAVTKNDSSILFELATYGAGAEFSDPEFEQWKSILQLLVKHGADPNRTNKQQHPPILAACRAGNLRVALALIEVGADPFYRSGSRLAPIEAPGVKKIRPALERAWLKRVQAGKAATVSTTAAATATLR